MKTRSVLAYFPGYPFSVETLMPDRQLATIAANLQMNGHVTTIQDYGSIETLARLIGPGRGENGVADARPPWPLSGIRNARRVREYLRRQKALCDEIAFELSSREAVDFICFRIENVDALHATVAIAERIRDHCPGVRILGLGSLVDLYGERILMETNAFDCLCRDDVESTLCQLAELIHDPAEWSRIGGVLQVKNGSVERGTGSAGPCSDWSAMPAYDAYTYPALREAGKLRLFEIEESRKAQWQIRADNVSRPSPTRLRLKPVAAVCEEMNAVARLYGGRAFYFVGAGSPGPHALAIARELLSRNIKVRYWRALDIGHVDAASYPLLSASGCVGLSLQVDTGSQRLLEDVYGRNFGVSDVERAFRVSRASGLCTFMGLTFPCAADDEHTREETLRLVARARPTAAEIRLPSWEDTPRVHGWARANRSPLDVRQYLGEVLDERAPATGQRESVDAAWSRKSRQARRALQEYRTLSEAIGGYGVSLSLSPQDAMTATFTGNGERLDAFGCEMRQRFSSGDIDGLADLVRVFNERACVPNSPVGLRPFAPLLAAVGN